MQARGSPNMEQSPGGPVRGEGADPPIPGRGGSSQSRPGVPPVLGWGGSLAAPHLGVTDGPPDVEDELVGESEVPELGIESLGQRVGVPGVPTQLHHGGGCGGQWGHSEGGAQPRGLVSPLVGGGVSLRWGGGVPCTQERVQGGPLAPREGPGGSPALQGGAGGSPALLRGGAPTVEQGRGPPPAPSTP